MAHVGEVEAHKGMLTGQVTTLRSKWSNASNDNMRLQAEVGTLRKTLQVGCARLATSCSAICLPIALLYAMWAPCARVVARYLSAIISTGKSSSRGNHVRTLV